MRRRLTKKQLEFLNFLRSNAGQSLPEETVRIASGLSPRSWRVYMSGGRYAPFLAQTPAGLVVTAEGSLTEDEFVAQVSQSRGPTELGKVSHSWGVKYRLDAKPLGRGGFAVVFRATRKVDGAVFALKRALPNDEARHRIRREIEVLSTLSSPHVMPIIDFDESSQWYCMPLACRTLAAGLPTGELPMLVNHILSAFEVVHGPNHGLTHRDVAPGNMMELEEGGAKRWVLSDWGTVRREPGDTTAQQTHSRGLLGTRAFAAPELWTDPHHADYRADYYGLGRVVAHLLGAELAPNVPAVPAGMWANFVRSLTQLDRNMRPQTLDEVRSLLPGAQPPVSIAAPAYSQGPTTPSGPSVDLYSLVEDSVTDFAEDLVNSDDTLTTRMAETNATGFALDWLDIRSVGPLELKPPRVPFHLYAHYSGEQREDKTFTGRSVSAELVGAIEFDGSRWSVVESEVTNAEIDDQEYDGPDYDDES